MKRTLIKIFKSFRTGAAGVLLPVLAFSACSGLLAEEDNAAGGTLTWHFGYRLDADAGTRAGEEIPDTNAFILTVTDASGKVLYEGSYGASPSELLVSPGSYTVSARSCSFTVPAFSKPQYGDDQVVVVKSGQTTQAALICRQLNSGVRLRIASSFLTGYPGGTLHLKSAAGTLNYGYSEKRIAYFHPGPVSLLLSDGGADQTLLTRSLAEQEILTLSVSVPASSSATSGGLRIQVDTARRWTSDSVFIGSGGSGGGGGTGLDPGHAFSVSEAKAHIGEEDVWVYGYIVGGDLSSSGTKMNTSPPFESDTHLTIAERSSVKDKASCLSVELRKGKIRDALNLKDNPELLGTQVFLCGNIVEAYYGIPGLKAVSDYDCP